MKKYLKMLSLVVICAFVFILGNKSLAQELNDKESSFLKEGEQVQEINNENEKTDIVKKANSLLLFLNIKNDGKSEKVFKVINTNSISGYKDYYKMIYNGNSYISFTENGDLVEADTFFYKVPKSDFTIRNRTVGNESSIDMFKAVMKDKGYVLTDLDENYGEGNKFYAFDKVIKGNITNKYDSYSVVYDPDKENIVSLTKVHNPVEYKKPSITLNEAKNIALKYSKEESTNIENSILGVYKDDNDIVKLGYVIKFKNGKQVVINPEDSKVVKEDVVKGYKGKAFAYDGFSHYRESLNMANNGLRRLGYSMLPEYVLTGNISSPIEGAITTSGFRALYVDSHGSPDRISTNGYYLDRDYLRRNYPNLKLRFVFLDACSTGENSGWASTFKINSNWGAFIGWSDSVYESDAYEFGKVFWREANGRRPILKAVDEAYRQTRPNVRPKFYGNSTFYGTSD